MEVELSDEEFEELTHMLLIQHSYPEARIAHELRPLEAKLIEKQLLEIKSKRISEDRTVDYIALTQWGYHVLTQEGLRLVLCLLELKAFHQALAHIGRLTQEELPILLTHNNIQVRARAAKAMQFWSKSKEELWEEFIEKRQGRMER